MKQRYRINVEVELKCWGEFSYIPFFHLGLKRIFIFVLFPGLIFSDKP